MREGTAALGKMPQNLSMGNSDVHTDNRSCFRLILILSKKTVYCKTLLKHYTVHKSSMCTVVCFILFLKVRAIPTHGGSERGGGGSGRLMQIFRVWVCVSVLDSVCV